MPLYVTRFGQFPYFFKILTLFFSLATVICLWGAPSSPGGTSLIWFTVVVALVIDIALIGVLALEIDRVQSPIRGFSYAALVRSVQGVQKLPVQKYCIVTSTKM
ncbi:unnamed protein product [Nippostrongylus brasiliensis]|uniref:Glutamate/aspartate:proton symporter n=1 Tax=Nippostrongylus brasiliensis TaxID=27835 RepID=A0A0N4XPP1_NIPBR|nr:unnamed protein product [Nippostrongylus brasiliensis]